MVAHRRSVPSSSTYSRRQFESVGLMHDGEVAVGAFTACVLDRCLTRPE